MARRVIRLATALLVLVVAVPPPLSGEEIDFDRPEAWALKYFASITQLTGLGPPRRLAPGETWLRGELGSVPQLSAAERTVGFEGTKTEDLNRTPVFGRLRLEAGLPRKFNGTLALTPPVEVDGATPFVLAAAVGRPIFEGDRWRLGWTAHLAGGRIEGDLTCTEEAAAAGDDPVANPFGCEEPSADEMRMLLGGLELALARRLGWGRGGEVYLAVSAQQLDAEFQVDARYDGIIDRMRLTTSGVTGSVATGLALPVARRWHLSGEIYYAPLEVRRPPFQDRQNDALLNVRGGLALRLR